jgi:hypothetical protein
MRAVDKAVERTFKDGKLISVVEVGSKSPLRRFDYKVLYKGKERIVTVFIDPLEDEGAMYLTTREDAQAFKRIYDIEEETT